MNLAQHCFLFLFTFYSTVLEMVCVDNDYCLDRELFGSKKDVIQGHLGSGT